MSKDYVPTPRKKPIRKCLKLLKQKSSQSSIESSSTEEISGNKTSNKSEEVSELSITLLQKDSIPNPKCSFLFNEATLNHDEET